MLLDKDQSCVVLIDVQEKLKPFILESDTLVANCQWLLSLSNELAVAKIVSEQYPSGLGPTVETLLSLINPNEGPLKKVHFSCWGDANFQTRVRTLNKKQFVLIGIETHVCVLQTAFQLLQANYTVFVVVDAVSSRKKMDHHFGLKRMKQMGVQLVTSEMVFFEWLRQTGTPEYKRLSATYLKK